MNNTAQFPTFRSAAEFYANAGWTYDEACEIVRNLMNDDKLVIQKTKTDWSLLGETVLHIVWIFCAMFAFGAMNAYVQIETATFSEAWVALSAVMVGAWLWSSCHAIKIFLVDFRRSV